MSNRYRMIVAVSLVVLVGAIFVIGFLAMGDIGDRFLTSESSAGDTSAVTTRSETTTTQSETTTATEPKTSETATEATTAEASTETTAETTSSYVSQGTEDGSVEEYIGTGYKRDPDAFKEIKAKAVYVSGSTASSRTALDKIIKMVNETELNAIVIDIKEGGKVHYKSAVPEVLKNKAYYEYYDPEEVTKLLHDNNIYAIARLVVFRDPVLAVKRPEFAIKKPDGTIWKENGDTAWTNPYKEAVWRYNLDIAKEAIEKGFDEIQFDYVRFPTAKKGAISYGTGMPSKSDTIAAFLRQSKQELGIGMNAIISADVFGIILEVSAEMDAIGQVLEKVVRDIDYICPMIYPSHYANDSSGTMGNGVGQTVNGVLFTKPDLEPYKLIYNALAKAKTRLDILDGHVAGIRPYIQGFTATYLPKGYYQTYGPEQIRQEMQGVYDAGYEEWIIWNSGNSYNINTFLKEP